MTNTTGSGKGFFRKIRAKAKSWLQNMKAPVEKKLLARTYREKTSQASVAFFTLHKTGSTFLSERLAGRFHEKKFYLADFGHYQLQQGVHFPDPLQQESTARYIFSRKGIFHKAIREPVDPDWLADTQVLLVTRDPRDIITSWYFSLKFSHVINNQIVAEDRRQAEAMTIDYFVVHSGHFEATVQKLETYRQFLGRSQVLHISYEDMVTQPEAIEKRIAGFLGLTGGAKKIFSPEDFVISGEDQRSHKRQVFPGDHVRKLSPETVHYCNERIRHLAPLYGWPMAD